SLYPSWRVQRHLIMSACRRVASAVTPAPRAAQPRPWRAGEWGEGALAPIYWGPGPPHPASDDVAWGQGPLDPGRASGAVTADACAVCEAPPTSGRRATPENGRVRPGGCGREGGRGGRPGGGSG